MFARCFPCFPRFSPINGPCGAEPTWFWGPSGCYVQNGTELPAAQGHNSNGPGRCCEKRTPGGTRWSRIGILRLLVYCLKWSSIYIYIYTYIIYNIYFSFFLSIYLSNYLYVPVHTPCYHYSPVTSPLYTCCIPCFPCYLGPKKNGLILLLPRVSFAPFCLGWKIQATEAGVVFKHSSRKCPKKPEKKTL